MTRERATDLEMLERHLVLDGQDVLDVGCGPGQLVRALAARGARPVGLEISAEQLAPALAADDGSGARYLVGRAEALPLPEASLDAVVFLRSLHHVPVPEQLAALAESHRVLRPGGRAYVAEPLAEGAYFELTCLVDDEREVRAAAQLAVAEAGRAGLSAESRFEYDLVIEVPDTDALRRRIVAVDPDRAAVFDARRAQIAARLAERGEPAPGGGWVVRQPMRVDLLRRELNAPGVG